MHRDITQLRYQADTMQRRHLRGVSARVSLVTGEGSVYIAVPGIQAFDEINGAGKAQAPQALHHLLRQHQPTPSCKATR